MLSINIAFYFEKIVNFDFLENARYIILLKLTKKFTMNSQLLNKNKQPNIGILGGGQLAKMMAQEAYKLGWAVTIWDKELNSPAGAITKFDISGAFDNKESLAKFIDTADFAILENEFIDPEIIRVIEEHIPVFPSSKTISKIQDKFKQKVVFNQAGAKTAKYQEINSEEDALNFGKENGYPFVLKTRTMGYDGYGNAVVVSSEGIPHAFSKLSIHSQKSKLYAESFVAFDKELAMMVARNAAGDIATYPLVETIQENNICKSVIAPADISQNSALRAETMAKKIVESIEGVGIFGIEFFHTTNGEILVNEIAPRPHNSGHYTIEACCCSQFQQAIRAVSGLPLGSTKMILPFAVMVNILGITNGDNYPANISNSLTDGNVSLHLYGKSASRTGRKMGHITAISDSKLKAMNLAAKANLELQW